VDERVAAVVLAAGAGTRFGGGKLLAALHGRPVLQHVLDRLTEAGLEPVIVVLGDDAEQIEAAVAWRDELRVRNPDPGRGLSSSLRTGIDELPADVEAALIALGDQPLLDGSVVRAILDAGVDPDRPIAAPRYADDGARNPVLLHRSAFELAASATGDRGLGPILAAHPELVRDIPVPGANPDVDTRADHVRVLETVWAHRVRANAEQVNRHREVPDGSDFYAPVTDLFRADPTRTDEPALDLLLRFVQPGDTWLDIGAGAGRYALPIARRLAGSGGRVIALEPSAGMRAAMDELAREHGIDNVDVVEGRWPDAAAEAPAVDVALIAHVGYDIERIGPFLGAMERAARRLCVAMLMGRQPSAVADVFWPSVWGEERVPLPALPEFLELLRALGRSPTVEWLDRPGRRFGSRDELAGYLRRQLWVAPGSEADARFLAALEDEIVEGEDGLVGLRGQSPLPLGVVTWTPGPAPTITESP
jgi:nicotine blue oxidoreductase